MSHQRHASQIENGHVLLFDNGEYSRRSGSTSRVAEIDPETNEIAWEYQGDPPMSFYSSYVSSADRLPNGNTLITEGAHGRILEVTHSGEIVWEYVNPFFFPGRDNASSNALFRAHRYAPDDDAVAGRDLDPGGYANLNRLYA
ncbi:MAG: arylsulfotransferase family protein [SAR202 cluster bacterium]|jgi:hypothetical protein|nr:arylsulfotransferase family protein [SAR202 cluster bacterium]